MPQDNVKDLLEEIKNLSELMLDLAYSSVFFKNKEIAEEVILSFDRFEDLEERLYTQLFAASRGQGDVSLISVIEIVESAKNVAMAARNLAEMVVEDKELHPVIHQVLEETDETIQRVSLSESSVLANKSLKELQLGAQVGIAVIGIRRRGEKHKWIFYPTGSTQLQAGDVVIGVGSVASCDKFTELASGKLKEM
jgi:uncharacterized protein with PhoU and TrkA domain